MSIEYFNQLKLGGRLVSKSIILGVNKTTRMNWIMADLEVRVSDEEDKRVRVSMFANEKKNDGNPNAIYKGIMTIAETYKSMNSTVKNKRINDKAEAQVDEATTVSSLEECEFIKCNKGVTLTMNRYMAEGELKEDFRLRANFVNRVAEDKVANEVSFIEGVLVGVVSEKSLKVEGDKEYIVLKLNVPEYRDAWGDRAEQVVIEKFEVILRSDDESAKDYVDSEFEVNSVVNVNVEPVIEVTTVVAEQPKEKRGFGKQVSFEPSTKTLKEIRMVGGYPLYEEEFINEKAFNRELYDEGLAEFDRKLEELKSDTVKEVSFGGSGFGRSSQKSSGGGNGLPF